MVSSWGEMDEWERRTLLKAAGPAGLGLISGCLGDDGDGDDGGNDTVPQADVPDLPGDDDDGASADDDGMGDDGETGPDPSEFVDPRDYVIDGQTLRLPLDVEDPSTAFFIGRNQGRSVYDVPGSGADLAMTVANGKLADGPGFHSAFNLEWRDFYSHFYEGDQESVWGEEVLTVEINEDATWSDGRSVRAFDTVLCNPGAACLGPTLPGEGWDARHRMEFPDGPDGNVMEVHVLPSWLGDGPKGMEPPGPADEFHGWRETPPNIYQPGTLGNFPKRGGVTIHTPSHIDPFDKQADLWWEVIQFRDKLVDENPEVWNDADHYRNFVENDPDGRRPFFRLWQDEAPDEWIEPWGGQMCWWQNARAVVGEGDSESVLERYEQSRDPEWMTSLGLYEIDEIVGSEGYRLVPNENHWLHDEHTFDEVFVEWVQEDHREVAGLMAERYDHSGVSLTPSEQDTVPDIYDLKTYPASGGLTFSLNHAYWPGQSVRVRQGLKFATDEANIAENLNPETNDPLQAPGADNWGVDDFIDNGWAEDTLTSYDVDRERATSLFEQAGFERRDGIWHDPTGEPIDEVIATTESAPVAEETMADQWREFGIQIETLIQDEATFEERWQGADDPLAEGIGDYAIAVNVWPSQTFGGFFSNAMRNVGSSHSFTYRRRGRNWFDEQGGHGSPQDKVDFTETVIKEGYAPINYAEPGSFTRPWEIPPVGEFDAPRSEWVPFNHPLAVNRVERGPYSWRGGGMPTNENLAQEAGREDPQVFDPDALGVDNLWQALAWSFNWFMPDLPIVRQTTESYINTTNFKWGGQVPDVDGLATPRDTVTNHWEFWGLGAPPYTYPGNNMVWGDPANPKLNAEVRDTR